MSMGEIAATAAANGIQQVQTAFNMAVMPVALQAIYDNINPLPSNVSLDPIYRLDKMELDIRNGFKSYEYMPLSDETMKWLKENYPMEVDANFIGPPSYKGTVQGSKIRTVTINGKEYTLNFGPKVNSAEFKVPSSEGMGDFQPPKVYKNAKGQITNGTQTIDSAGMQKHLDGTPGKSQFLYDVDAEKAVLDAAAYADEYNLWQPSSGNDADFADKAKVPVVNGNVGITGSGELTNYINIYRTKTGFVHGCPGNPGN